MCEKQRRRRACAYRQSVQSLCLSLEYSMTLRLLTKHHLEFLSLKGGCTGSSKSTLVKILHCWKSHVAAQMSKNPVSKSRTHNSFSQFHFHVYYILTASLYESLDFATFYNLMEDINLIDSCQAHLPVQYASNIKFICKE